MKIGVVDYLNALPFSLPYRLGYLHSDRSFTYAIPTELNRQLKEGLLDAALTSSATTLPFLSAYGISAHKEVLSVNLYLSGSLDGRIGITSESATSVELLKILCRFHWKVEPTFLDLSSSNLDGFLLIGDAALQCFSEYKRIDLATAWYEMTGLPFVFALISIRQGIDYQGEEFEKALIWSESHHEELLLFASERSGFPTSLLKKYYQVCRYRLGDKEREGLKLFHQLRKHVSEIGT